MSDHPHHTHTDSHVGARNASTLLTINVNNGQANPNNFFFFQKPAIYVGGPTIYSNSLFQRGAPPKGQGGQITFMANIQYYAGIQDADTAAPAVGSTSGYSTAAQAISLAAQNNTPPNSDSCAMLYDPNTKSLGLSNPANAPGVMPGAFRVVTSTFSSPPTFFNVGSAVSINGQIVLSNFISAQPNQNVDCEPILTYYVATGTYTAGTVMNFDASSVNSAVCDFTGGYVQANVTYQADGTWAVQMS